MYLIYPRDLLRISSPKINSKLFALVQRQARNDKKMVQKATSNISLQYVWEKLKPIKEDIKEHYKIRN